MLGASRYLGIALVAGLPLTRGPLAQPEDPGRPDWRRYHGTAETHALLDGWAKAFPRLTELYSIGQTLKGTPLMVMEITNEDTGPASRKPACNCLAG